MIDFSRYKAIAVALAAVFAALLFWDVLLARLYAQTPAHDRAILERMQPDVRRDTGRVIAQLEHTLEAQPTPFGVILGQSTARRGIDPLTLGQLTGLRWSNLAVGGGSFTQLRYYAEPLLASTVRPAVAVIGGHAVWLAERGEAALATPQDDTLSPTHGATGFGAVRNSIHNSIRLAIDLPIERARVTVLRAFGVNMRVVFPGRSRDPWAQRDSFKTLASPEDRALSMDQLWEAFRWFDEAAYHLDNVEAERLRSLITALQARGTAVVFAILPEPPGERDKPPPRARKILLETLDSLEDINVLDHWDALSNRGLFYDRMHLNRNGRAQYSKRLAADLMPILRKLQRTRMTQ